MPNKKAHDRKEDKYIAEYSYTALFKPAEEGGYVVTVPALPGLVTEGDTLEEAREIASEKFPATVGKNSPSLGHERTKAGRRN